MAFVLSEDFDSLRIQFYVVSGVFGFLIIVLIALLINLTVKVYSRRNDDDDADEDDVLRKPPPPVNSTFSLPKPNLNKNWRDPDAEIRRQNNEHEHKIPKPALSKSWNAYPGDRYKGRNQPRPQFEDDNLSNYSYDGTRSRSPLSPVSKSSGSAFRNPLSGNSNNELESRFDFSKNRTDKPKPPAFKPGGGQSSHLHGGNFNHGFNRNFERERDNNYY